MRIKNIIIALSFMLININVSSAIEPNKIVSISLKDAIELAKNRNLDIKTESLDIEKIKNDIKKANRLKNPELFSYNNFGSAGKNEPQLVGISQPIELLKRSARKNFEKANLEFVKDNYESQLFLLEISVREAYINLVVAKSILTVNEEQKLLLQELLSDLEKSNDKNNEEAKLEIMQAEIALNLVIAKINTAKSNVENARLAFNKSLNVKNGDDITFDCSDINLLEKREFSSLMTPLITPTISGGNIEVKISANSATQAQELIKTLPYFKSFIRMPFAVNEAGGKLEQLISQAHEQ